MIEAEEMIRQGYTARQIAERLWPGQPMTRLYPRIQHAQINVRRELHTFEDLEAWIAEHPSGFLSNLETRFKPADIDRLRSLGGLKVRVEKDRYSILVYYDAIAFAYAV